MEDKAPHATHRVMYQKHLALHDMPFSPPSKYRPPLLAHGELYKHKKDCRTNTK